jgi:hypothetical protein
MGECEFRFETEPSVLKLVLKARTERAASGSRIPPVTPAARFRTTPRASGDDERGITESRQCAGGSDRSPRRIDRLTSGR